MTDVKSELNTKPNGADAAPEVAEQKPVDGTGADVVMVDGAMAEGEAAAAAKPRLNTAAIRKDDAAIAQLFEQGVYPYKTRMRRVAYEQEKAKLQVELLKAQRWIEETGQKVVMLFEGRDAAGKGGTIKRFTEHLNPRTARVVALNKPTDRERSQWYFQRYIEHLPAAGEMVLFDRSWYNRAGVERVMGFCTPTEYLEFMREAPEIERMLTRSGILLFKYWFSVTQGEQLRRFGEREKDPLKQWKLSPIDKASLDKWDDYTEAKEAMFFYTDTADAPWTIVKSDCKKRARLNCMKHFLSSLPYPNKDHLVVHHPDRLIVGSSSHVIGTDDHILGKTLHPDVRKPKMSAV
ncbi:polyphosphate kinase 2 [Hoeflea alexandrii]|uniref:polyphosphate kinase 2 n=1 Tax=Hoeflea alexandrii TaxID=288436 RepID=UPI0022AE998A|nr:polyphosphate kinase 2 [Hoeflea alexandrii]MCZ4291336.1 polyphosphate kinase 2 [Hoeflea alexandrii]